MNKINLCALLGKAINEEAGLKYPKKDTVSLKADSLYYIISVIENKQRLELAFSMESNNPFVNPEPAEKKNQYYPNLTTTWIRVKSKITLPLGLDYTMMWLPLSRL